jgi:uncharacterized Zn-binding protein involved in type VI secretion
MQKETTAMSRFRHFLLVAALLACMASPSLAGTSAARLGDTTNHGGVLTAGSGNVLIQGLPAAVFNSFVSCPILFHVGGNILTGSPTVFINGLPAVRTNSLIVENGANSVVIGGATTVLIQ